LLSASYAGIAALAAALLRSLRNTAEIRWRLRGECRRVRFVAIRSAKRDAKKRMRRRWPEPHSLLRFYARFATPPKFAGTCAVSAAVSVL